MKILYFGTVCDLRTYNEKLNQCRVKPSVAPIVFESALMEGLYRNHAEIEIHSFPMIPAFPGSKLLYFGGNTERLPCGYECRWLKTVNLPGLRQLSRRMDARRIMKKWMRGHAGEGLVLTYSVPPFLVADVMRYARRYRVKTAAIVPDLLRDMYMNDKTNPLVARMKQIYLSSALRLQSAYDGYVYLTEEMKNAVAPDRPYTVMEGIASLSDEPAGQIPKSSPRAVMYAGMLHEKYGIINLVRAFEEADVPDTELWLFGDGTAAEQIRTYAQKDPRIRYFGTVPRGEILAYERKATLLVNPRDPGDEFTKYSFPSKTIEYMLSGTPLLTTKLQGIPTEYLEYLFVSPDNSVEHLSLAISDACSRPAEELRRIGENARGFILREKNAKRQAARVLDFLREVNDEPSDQ